ncbi:MAG: OmpH family outer membrane protein [Candidatus Omnitrophica bacterium]|nr:OmpH family outer membrane protein [Candidatus Omnitrophota bacterium]MCM8802747.1 OmpH family outer membrane protein [Candidatus Omnitrophota bacterium]
MKKILFFLSFMSICLLAQNSKIGYIDIKKVFDNYEEAKKTEANFKKEVDEAQKDLDKLEGEVKKMQEDYEKKKNMMKPEEQTKKENELKGKIQELSKKYLETKQRLDERGKTLENQIFENIKKAISEYAKKNGYSIVVDSRMILYGEDAVDLTEEIIKILNKK